MGTAGYIQREDDSTFGSFTKYSGPTIADPTADEKYICLPAPYHFNLLIREIRLSI